MIQDKLMLEKHQEEAKKKARKYCLLLIFQIFLLFLIVWQGFSQTLNFREFQKG